MMNGWTRVLAGVSLSCAAPGMAADPAATKFGAREFIQQISLSPDGTHVAMVAPNGPRGAVVLVADLQAGGSPKPVLQSSGDPDRLTGCNWSTNTRLICSIYMISKGTGLALQFTRVVSLNSDGSGLKMLSAKSNARALGIMQNGGDVIDWTADGAAGSALMTRLFVPEYSTGTMLASRAEGLGVERIDTTTLARHIVEQPRADASEYISDGRGVVRIMGITPRSGGSGYRAARTSYLYRKAGGRDWLPLGVLDYAGGASKGFDPYAVDPDLNVAYGFDDLDGRRALYKVALDGSLKRELVFARPDVDVAGLVRIGRQDRVVGVSYVTDRREIEFFDSHLKALGVSLRKALPNRPIVSFVDASADESKLLLFAGSDNDPGRYYVFDKATRHMAEVMEVRPELAGTTLATVKPVSFPARDGTMIPGYLTLPPGGAGKNIPAIVMPHGGPGDRDEWGFDWLVQYFAARGYAVLQPEFRGSTGYGSAWFQKNGFQSWRTAIGDVDDAGRWLQSQGIAAPGRMAIVGWSYGGYAALQSGVVDPGLFKAIVAVAPVTDLETLREESRDYSNYRIVDTFIGHGAHVREGSPARNAGAIKVPVLLFHGNMDRNVGIGESRLMASKLREAGCKVELVEFDGLDHQLDDAVARTAMLDKAGAFLAASLGS